MNVLLTCSGARVDMVRAFQDVLAAGPHHGRVIVADAGDTSPTVHIADGAIEVPMVSAPGYADAILAGCRANDITAVLPVSDLDPVILAELAPSLAESGTTVFLPTPEVALGCQDKWDCLGRLSEAGLPSPPSWRGNVAISASV